MFTDPLTRTADNTYTLCAAKASFKGLDLTAVLEMEALRKLDYSFTGSRIICTPAPTLTDLDVVILVTDLEATTHTLIEGWWEVTSEYDTGQDEQEFVTARKGLMNLIIYSDPQCFHAWVDATSLATKMNLIKKEDRVALFQAVMSYRRPPVQMEVF